MRKHNGFVFACCCLAVFLSTLSAQEILEAVKSGDLGKVKTLVEKNPGIVKERGQGGALILFAALRFRQREIADYLISKGADVNVRDNFGNTPLHVACGTGLSLDFVKLLVEKGADVNAVADYSGRPLDTALEDGDTSVSEYLTSQGARSTPLQFDTHRLGEKIHRIAYPWGMRNNIVVFSGPDGILLVDTGFSKRAVSALRQVIGGMSPGEIKYVVNTHLHGDHVEGNGIVVSDSKVINFTKLSDPAFGKIIARGDRPFRGGSGRELPVPSILRFNGEEIQIIPNPGLHSEADILVYFPKSNVLCMGDLLLSQNCPALQDVAGYMDLLDQVLDVFPGGTIFVSGHGRDLTRDGLVRYRDDLAGMIEIVRKNQAAGKSVEDMLRDDVLKSYKADYSFLAWIGPDSWLRSVAQALRSGKLK
jgi:cyclase